MLHSSNKIPRILPQPEIITTARRNIRSDEFKEYLEETMPDINDSTEFIDFLDEALKNLGKGIAYVHWQHGRIHPTISIGSLDPISEDACIGINDQSYERGHFPDIIEYHTKLMLNNDSDRPSSVVYNLLSLSDHRSGQNVNIAISLKHMYNFYLYPTRDQYLSLTGSDISLSNEDSFIARGAHEAFHVYDAIYHAKRCRDEQNSYLQPRSDNEFMDYLNYPIEVRAQKAARDALIYYAKSVEADISL